MASVERNRLIRNALLEKRNEVILNIKKKNYLCALKVLTNATKQYLIEKSEYDRFSDVLPYDRSVAEKFGIPYINASFVNIQNEKYIACQEPKPEFERFFLDFVKKAGIGCIIVLKKSIKYTNRCQLVSTETVKFNGKDFIRDSILKNDGSDLRIINVLAWEDHKILEREEMEFLWEYCSNLDNELKIVHCKAGVGRTGTFIAFRAIKKMKRISIDELVDVLIELRAQRIHLVENDCQLQFLVEYFCEKEIN